MKKLPEDRKFKAWLWWLTRAAILGDAKIVGYSFKEGTVFSPEHWKVYYDEGLHVHEALKEDFTHI